MSIDKKKPFVEEIKLVNHKVFNDNRGSFSKLYSTNNKSFLNKDITIKQINISHNMKVGTVRGLHFQNPPVIEEKIVTCLKGSIFDVVVDLRKESKNFLKWQSISLSEKDNFSIYIPKGFAHGFQTLEVNTSLLYFHSEDYVSAADNGINPLDPFLNINWPIEISEISDKDSNQKKIDETFLGF